MLWSCILLKYPLIKPHKCFYISQNIYCMPLTENNAIKAVGKRYMRILTNSVMKLFCLQSFHFQIYHNITNCESKSINCESVV